MSKLTEKWSPLLEASEKDKTLPEIATQNKKEICAMIFENQEQELASQNHIMSGREGELQEAVISGNSDGTGTQMASGENSGAIVHTGPMIMGMARRAIPQLLAFETVGVQPLKQPTGQVFFLRSMYGKDPRAAGAKESMHPSELPLGAHSGTFTDAIHSDATTIAGLSEFTGSPTTYSIGDIVKRTDPEVGVGYFQCVAAFAPASADADAEWLVGQQGGYFREAGQGLLTSYAELMENFNGSSGNEWNEMSFRIDKQTVEARSRQLKAQYSIELAQDLQATYGISADAELTQLLSSEIVIDLDREIISAMNVQAQPAKTGRTLRSGTAGVWDGVIGGADVRGARWFGEAAKSLFYQIELESQEIGRQTGRGNANFILASSDVISYMSMANALKSPGESGYGGNLGMDVNSNAFVGTLADRYRVYVDKYSQETSMIIGYSGAGTAGVGSMMDNGICYSPYVPLTPLRGQNSQNFQPVMGVKTRYALSINPTVEPEDSQIFTDSFTRGIGKNQFYRKLHLINI